MASQVRIQVELNSDGIKALLNSEGIEGACRAAADRIRARAGEHYHVSGPYHPGSRVMFRVYPDDEGRLMEARDKTLTSSVKADRQRG